MPVDVVSLEHAWALDAADPLASFRERFYLPEGKLYFDGNSLGLLSTDAEAAVLTALDQWKRLAIGGWMEADPAWFTFGEELGRLTAPLVGAEADEVVVTGTTTVNLHNLVATFYRPDGERREHHRDRARFSIRHLRAAKPDSAQGRRSRSRPDHRAEPRWPDDRRGRPDRGDDRPRWRWRCSLRCFIARGSCSISLG